MLNKTEKQDQALKGQVCVCNKTDSVYIKVVEKPFIDRKTIKFT